MPPYVFGRRRLEFRMGFIRIYLRVLGLLRSDAKLAIVKKAKSEQHQRK